MKITIAGCGNMGLIYARAFLKYDIVARKELLLAEKNETRKEQLKQLHIGEVTVVNDGAIKESDIIVLAVKPQDFTELAIELKKAVSEKNVIISIMAGIKIASIADALGTKNIVRAMPNSPAELGLGMTAFTAPKEVEVDKLRKAENLLATTGRTVFLEDENLLDAVTALSGSGPAYFFYLVKNMVEAGVKMGFSESVSAMLVKQTMLGSFHLLNTADRSLDELIKAVASKGGTTEAAFGVFEKMQVGEHLQRGILRAEERARELAEK